MLSSTNARLVAARRLTRRAGRREAGRFLCEGAQCVREALAADAVLELFATAEAISRNADLLAGHPISEISTKDATALSETVKPQGLIAVCRLDQPTPSEVLDQSPRLVVVLVEPNEPGNLGAIIRTADAAGADAVFVDAGADPYNGKAVRATAGGLFHLPVVSASTQELLPGIHQAGMVSLATSARARDSLDQLADDGTLGVPTAWIFGNEAHGLPESVLGAVDRTVRIPIHGRAESLNLAVAAGVCLFASAREQRREKPPA